jgi:hypothetical protein
MMVCGYSLAKNFAARMLLQDILKVLNQKSL